ncbi:unnamed protein product [Orchesella dallaii]|uniref:Peptidase A2 domain-containing protein n=1 Tax=Orchesella dallaii TaxID=48710 RepID=A0ABP1S1L2_9HEXA
MRWRPHGQKLSSKITEPGKRPEPESNHAVNLGEAQICRKQFSVNKLPYIEINILGQTIPALLDTGSSISIIGDELIEKVMEQNLPLREEKLKKLALCGAVEAALAVELDIEFPAGVRKHKFILLPNSIKYVLLGRDFIGAEDIGIFISKGGYTIGNDQYEVRPFTKAESLIPLSHTTDIENDTVRAESHVIEDRLEDFVISLDAKDQPESIPATVLFNWAREFEDEEEKEPEFEENLEPLLSGRLETILVPSELAEYKKEKLREIITSFDSLFSPIPGLCTLYTHRIDTGLSAPVKSRYCPMSKGKREAFDETFDELLELGSSMFSMKASFDPKYLLKFYGIVVPDYGTQTNAQHNVIETEEKHAVYEDFAMQVDSSEWEEAHGVIEQKESLGFQQKKELKRVFYSNTKTGTLKVTMLFPGYCSP